MSTATLAGWFSTAMSEPGSSKDAKRAAMVGDVVDAGEFKEIAGHNGDEEDRCSICLQGYVDRAVLPDCSHEFCFECIMVWMGKYIDQIEPIACYDVEHFFRTVTAMPTLHTNYRRLPHASHPLTSRLSKALPPTIDGFATSRDDQTSSTH